MPILHVIELSPNAGAAAFVASGGAAAGDRVVVVGATQDADQLACLGIRANAVVSPTLRVASSAGRRLESLARRWMDAGWACERVVPWSAGAFEACARLDELVHGHPELAQPSGGLKLGEQFARVRPIVRPGGVPTVAVLVDPAEAAELTPYVQVMAMADKAGAAMRVLAPRGCLDQARARRLYRECGIVSPIEFYDEPLWAIGFDVGLLITATARPDATSGWAAAFWVGACRQAGVQFVTSDEPVGPGSSFRANLARQLASAVQSVRSQQHVC